MQIYFLKLKIKAMAKEEIKVIIKRGDLTNNCPECFKLGFRVGLFYQRHTYGRLYDKNALRMLNHEY